MDTDPLVYMLVDLLVDTKCDILVDQLTALLLDDSVDPLGNPLLYLLVDLVVLLEIPAVIWWTNSRYTHW